MEELRKLLNKIEEVYAREYLSKEEVQELLMQVRKIKDLLRKNNL